MIIEFLGVSGVGKTTIAKEYKRKLEAEGKWVIWDTYELYANKSWFIRNIYKSVIVVKFCVQNYDWAKNYRRFLEKEIEDRKDFRRPLFNGIFLKALLVNAKLDKKIHIFDEGCLQYLLAIKLRGKKCVTKHDIEEMEMFYGLPDQLVVVDANAEVIVDRIKSRGEYVRIMDEGNLSDSVKNMQYTQDLIVKCLGNAVNIVIVKNN